MFGDLRTASHCFFFASRPSSKECWIFWGSGSGGAHAFYVWKNADIFALHLVFPFGVCQNVGVLWEEMALQMKVKEHQDAAAKLNAATEVRTLATWQRLDSQSGKEMNRWCSDRPSEGPRDFEKRNQLKAIVILRCAFWSPFWCGMMSLYWPFYGLAFRSDMPRCSTTMALQWWAPTVSWHSRTNGLDVCIWHLIFIHNAPLTFT